MPNPVNITQGKIVSASGYVTPYEPARAIDGSTAPYSRWLVASSSGWLMVNLGGMFKVTNWGVTCIGQAGWSQTCNLSNFKLQVNTSSVASPVWIDVDPVMGNTANTISRTVAVKANALRLHIAQGDSRPVSQLASILNFSAMGYALTNNAYLANLTLSSGTLSPVFSSSQLSYSAAVANSVASITVTPTVQDPDATITVNNRAVASGAASQPISLNVGQNTITVTVTSPDLSTTKTYTITVTRQSVSANADLSNLTISSGTLTPGFTSANTSYSDTVASSVSTVTVTPTAADASATIKVNGQVVASGTVSQAISLNTGSNSITVNVTAPDGVTTKQYTITVTRPSSDANLVSLAVNNAPLPIPFTDPSPVYNLSVEADVASATVTPTAEDPNATIRVNGQVVASGSPSPAITLTTGVATPVQVVVTAQDGTTTKTYTVNITRQAYTTKLTALIVQAGRNPVTLNPPTFSGTVLFYTAVVSNTTTGVTVKPTAAYPNDVKITVAGNLVPSGGTSPQVTLTGSSTDILIVVQSKTDPSLSTQYKVTVTK
ncbi:hypothetical protein GTO89_16500 [Heliobacterium gestii]|uniref:Cadherin-like beta-sandwich-like domain-containing protein n=1 Tax=Heliomicrobium gestii TaxID=2699 RepID=A0A845LGS6_HELGE|nr:cadherin-like beta sandwich domain-containing protein [Heliomicrobium gestii]MBM7868451.1 hypothetical protein [Heliomicrobium gestii]MZP44624.1 hypothetical protein [Heliomicrobium gestii]